MPKCKGVSSKTHTQKQRDDYANQHNPNNKAYKARAENEQKYSKDSRRKANSARIREAKREAKLFHELGLDANLDWMCYSNPTDFD